MPPEFSSLDERPVEGNHPHVLTSSGVEEVPFSTADNNNDGRMSDLCDKYEEIVIAGMSGKFPESSNIQEFRENLFNGVNMVTDDNRRFNCGTYGLPPHGKLKELDKFDATFFGVHAKQADVMDPQLRILHELTFEAFLDAGINPTQMRGSRTSVFIGVSTSESAAGWTQDLDGICGYELTGTCRAMFANRLSFTFDLRGPSYAVDTACSSSLLALEQAVSAIRAGHCDAAIVGGVNLCLTPAGSLQFLKLNMLAPDGKCKSFDASANGYARSEASVVIYICKATVAKRSYATILHAKTNTDGHKDQGVTYPSGQSQKNLLEEIYAEAGISPSQVAYVECHGTGTKVGDPEELNAIFQILCKNRDPSDPLLIGSVKSNMGHSEPASGLCSVVKVLLSMQSGLFPGNLHFQNPNPNIPSLINGQLKVVDKTTDWNPTKRGIVGINSFGFGGSNVHIILKSRKLQQEQPTTLPLLIPISGRTPDTVEFMLQEIMHKPLQHENLSTLFHQIASEPIPGYPTRGFTILNPDSTVSDFEVSQLDCATKEEEEKQIWFVFSGMGSQWIGMGRSLLIFSIFEQSLQNSAQYLSTRHVDLLHILHKNEDDSLDVLESFLCITAIQVALVDLLRALGIFPHGLIGHSIGELGCAYADECLTAEQTVLTAWARGRAILDSNLDVGAMAAVGLSWEEATPQCPSAIYPACHNAKDSVTISGPPDKIQDFVQHLENSGVFARLVDSSGQAFHSPYMKKVGPILKSYLEKIIPHPKSRSNRWISTSLLQKENGCNFDFDPFLASPDYFVNNLLSPVSFHDNLINNISSNAIVIEIGPHCILQAILKRSLTSKCVVGLNHKQFENGATYFLKSIGKLFNWGLNPKFQNLYPNPNFPLGVDTPSISSLVRWDHSQSWDVPNFDASPVEAGHVTFEIDLNSPAGEFYKGHKVDDRLIFPGAGYIVMVWKTFVKRHCSILGKNFHEIPVILENVKIHRATVLEAGVPTKFFVSFLHGSGQFQIEEQNSVVMSGVIREPIGGSVEKEMIQNIEDHSILPVGQERDILNTKEVYKTFRLIGSDMQGEFQSVHKDDPVGQRAEVQWTGNWVTYLDSLLQLNSLYISRKVMYLPTGMQKIVIDPSSLPPSPPLQSIVNSDVAATEDEELTQINLFNKEIDDLGRCTIVPTAHYPHLKVLKSPGLEIRGITSSFKQPRPCVNTPTLQKYEFTPFLDAPIHQKFVTSPTRSKNRVVRLCTSIILDTLPSKLTRHLEILEFLEAGAIPVFEYMDQCISLHLPKTTSKVVARARMLELNPGADVSRGSIYSDVVIAHRHVQIPILTPCLKPSSFLLYDGPTALKVIPTELQTVVQKLSDCNRHIYLFRKREELSQFEKPRPLFIEIKAENYDWLDQLKSAMQDAALLQQPEETLDKAEGRIYLVSKDGATSGILGLTLTLMHEPGGHQIRCLYIKDRDSFLSSWPSLASLDAFESEEWRENGELKRVLELDLSLNVFENGAWGTYCHYKLEEEELSHSEFRMENGRRVKHASLQIGKTGDLTSFSWVESPFFKGHEESSDEIIDVYYAPLNFRDVMLATGKISVDVIPDCNENRETFGLEFSGVNSKTGKKVMGLASEDQGLATTALAHSPFIWDVPSTWTLAEASTVPTVYCTVYYALIVRGRMREKESILIHSGAGGVGQAAIGLALSMNCKVYTTVGSTEKKEFLQKIYPQLEDRHFAHSRNTSFEQHVMKETGGRGVDLVLNSLAGELLQASLRVVGKGGRFLEIGKADIAKNVNVGLGLLIQNVEIHGVHLDHLLKDSGSRDREEVSKLMQEGLVKGHVRPLPKTIFGSDEIEPAFRFMGSGKHCGKIVIQIKSEVSKNLAGNFELHTNVVPKVYFEPRKIFVVIGGLGGVGLEMCHWLVEKGVRKLVLVGRSGVTTAIQRRYLSDWEKIGVKVVVSQEDLTILEGTEKLFVHSMEMLRGEVGGIFNLAMVLKDGLVENLTADDFDVVGQPKIDVTKNLDVVSRKMVKDLDYFVFFSSVAAAKGNPGQANYSFANSFSERICEERRKDGLAGLAIQWGAVGDVGVVIDQLNLDNEANIGGTKPQKIRSLLQSLEEFLLQSQNGTIFSSWCYHFTKSVDETRTAKTSMIDDIGRILGIKEMSKVNKTTSLLDLGMDSLMSMEVKLLLEKHHVTVPTDKIGHLTLQDIVEFERETQEKFEQNGENGDSDEFSIKKLPPNNIVWMAPRLMPQETVVKMESAHCASGKRRDGLPIYFFVHPIDGFVVSMEKLASRLKGTVYGLQCTKEAPLDSIEDLASFYIEKMKAVQPFGPYALVAYSYGGPVGTEISIQLQKNGEEVSKIIFLDSSYKLLEDGKSMKDVQSLKPKTTEADACILCYFMLCFLEFEYKKLREHLIKLETFEGMLERTVELLSPVLEQFPVEEIRDCLISFREKTCAVGVYHLDNKFKKVEKTRAILIRIQNIEADEEDYGLGEIFEEPVDVQLVGGTHVTMMTCDRFVDQVAQVISSVGIYSVEE